MAYYNKGGGRKLQRHIHHHDSVCNGTQPPHILHFRNVVYARSLSEMCAARRDMVQVACCCAAHTVFALPVAIASRYRPIDVPLPGWRPVPSKLGWQSAVHATTACDHSGSRSFGWMSYLFRSAIGLFPLFFPLRDTGFDL